MKRARLPRYRGRQGLTPFSFLLKEVSSDLTQVCRLAVDKNTLQKLIIKSQLLNLNTVKTSVTAGEQC